MSNLSYEEAVKRLEEIVKNLESDNLTLEESIKNYEEGIGLYNYCSDLLKNYEGKIKILANKENGEFKDFQGGIDE